MWNMGTDQGIQKKDIGIQKEMLQKGYANRIISESNEKNSTAGSKTEKTTTAWTYIQNEWQSKGQVAGFYRTNYASAVYAVIVCPSVYMSVTSQSCTKMAKSRIT